MIEAELHLAYAWDCDGCGRENWERAITREEPGETPETLYPDTVVCRTCGKVYSTKLYVAGEEEDYGQPELPDGSEEETE